MGKIIILLIVAIVLFNNVEETVIKWVLSGVITFCVVFIFAEMKDKKWL